MQSQVELDAAVAEYNTQGWPRGVTLQLTRNMQTFRNVTSATANTQTDTQGIQVDAYIETPDFGALSIHALALGGGGSAGLTSWSVRQTGLPFDGGWRADNALGITNLLVPDLARRNSRLALPTSQILGGSTLWRNEGVDSLVFGASAGEPGRFEGYPQSQFVRLGGKVSSVFVQATTGKFTGAAAVASGSDILPEVARITEAEIAVGAARISPRAFYVSVARDDLKTGVSLQASAIGSETSGIETTGLWADAIWRNGGHRHQVSLYRFAPGLSWIDRPLAADLRGASYRYDYNSLRWDLSTNLETFASISGLSPDGWYASASGRRLLTTALSAGGGLAGRDYGSRSASGFGYLQWRNDLGISRLQFDAASTQDRENSQALTLDHSIYAESGLSLSTTLSVERLQPINNRVDIPRSRQNAFALGLIGRAPLTNNLYLQGSVRARDLGSAGLESGTTLAASIGIDWQITRDWSFGASLYANRGVMTDTLAVQSPLVVQEFVRARPDDRGYFLALRYNLNAGTPSVPLGGSPGSGAGAIEGSVFLDSNSNGQRDGNESGAANILVILDGKFSTRTNTDGFFEFPRVVSGQHTLAVLQDDLPLPWSVDTERKINAVLSTRETIRVDIGAKRTN